MNQLTPMPDEPEGQSDVQPFIPDAGGADLGADVLGGGSTPKKLNGGLILLVGVVLVAGAALFSMRALAQMSTAYVDDALEATVSNYLKQLDDSNPTGTLAVFKTEEEESLAVISESYTERQIPLRDVQRDPFVIEIASAPQTDPSDPTLPPPPPPTDNGRAEREEEIKTAGRRLELKAILGGSRPLAIIDGETVRVGETLEIENPEVVFRVLEINKSEITLVATDPEFDLTVNVTLALRR